MLTLFFFLLLLGAIAAIGLIWAGMMWLLDEQRTESERPVYRLSISGHFARELEARWIWRKMSDWMGSKPLRLEDRSSTNRAG